MNKRFKKKLIITTLPIIMIIMFTSGLSTLQAESNLPVDIKKTARVIKAKLSAPVLEKLKFIKKKIIQEIINKTSQADIFRLGKKYVIQSGINLKELDIDEIVQLVMFETWQMNEEDLRDMLSEMQEMNKVKKKAREYINFMKDQKAKARNLLRSEYSKLKTRGILKIESKVSAPFSVFTPTKKRTTHFRIEYVTIHKTGKIIKNQMMTPERLKVREKEYETALNDLTRLIEKLSLQRQTLLNYREKLIQILRNTMKRISRPINKN